MEYVIGSFNIRDFNYSNQTAAGEKIARDFDKIAQIINLNFLSRDTKTH